MIFRDKESAKRVWDNLPLSRQKFIKYVERYCNWHSFLDVGCGDGDVISHFRSWGVEAYGVDIYDIKNHVEGREVYDGKTLPYSDNHFQVVCSQNVLEHTENPEEIIEEMIRVTKLYGFVIISCPNFLRVIPWRLYHPQMKKCISNFFLFLAKLFDKSSRIPRMDLVKRSGRSFQYDDDALSATNMLDIERRLKKHCHIIYSSCDDKKDGLLGRISIVEYLTGNVFIVAQKKNYGTC